MLFRILILTIIIIIITTTAMAALPPGFDEEIFCPDQMCLRRRLPPTIRKMTGPRAMFLECFNPLKKETCRPRVWGEKLDVEYKNSLLRDGWQHADQCEKSILDEFSLVGSRLDNILETLAMLSFI